MGSFRGPLRAPPAGPPLPGGSRCPGPCPCLGTGRAWFLSPISTKFLLDFVKKILFFIGWFFNKIKILYNWGCRLARPAWVLVRAGCGLVAGCSPPPRPPVRPPWGGLPNVPPLFPFPVARRFSATAYPFPPPAGGQPTLRRAGLLSIASPCQGSGQVTPQGGHP